MREFYQAFRGAERLNRKKQKGFTLIELLVVIAIIAILAAIAIPQFAKYRVRAYNGAAESDLRNIRTTMEAVYADVQSYGNNSDFDDVTAGGDGILTISVTVGSVTVTENISLSTRVAAGIKPEDVEFTAASAHKDGDKMFCVDSDDSSIWWAAKARGTALTNGDVPTPDGTAGDNECSGTFANRL